MAKTIQQKVVFKNTTPNVLYDLYMDSKKHSIATAAPAKLSTKEGGVIRPLGTILQERIFSSLKTRSSCKHGVHRDGIKRTWILFLSFF